MPFSTRRRFLKAAAATSLLGALPGCDAGSRVLRNGPLDSAAPPGLVKSPVEQAVNPFGYPWAGAKTGGELMVASSSAYRLTRKVEGTQVLLEAGPEFQAYHSAMTSPYHYDETIAKLTYQMPLLQSVQSQFEALGITKKWMGYTVAYYAESDGMPGFADMPEEYFLHNLGTEPVRENRIKFKDGAPELDATGDIFDLRVPQLRNYMAHHFIAAMEANNLDALLIDYSVFDHSFGSAQFEVMPEGYFLELLDNQFFLFEEITRRANEAGREIFLNGVTMNGIHDTTWAKVNVFGKVCHGLFWEQPFRTEWRDNETHRGYFSKLMKFADIATQHNVKFIWKQGSYLMTQAENPSAGWNWRFGQTDAEKERAYVDLFVAMFRIITGDNPNHTLIYTHPIEEFDIYFSEAYFLVFGEQLGAADGPPLQLGDSVIARNFKKSFIIANFSDDPFVWEEHIVAPLSVLRLTSGRPKGLSHTILTADDPAD